MLNTLHIENIAVIENIDIELDNGFIVFTGETGAGKSIVIDAIEMLLGARTPKSIIRTGQNKAVVIGGFSNISLFANKALGEINVPIEPDGMLLVERVLYADGRNICKINGKQITITMLKQVASELINIHGQNENQKLLDVQNHIKYLDEFAKNDKILKEYSELYIKAIKIRNNLKKLIEASEKNDNKIELLEYSIKEIENAKLYDTELEVLSDNKKKAQNSQKIKETLRKSGELFETGDLPINSVISDIISSFSQIKEVSNEYCDIYTRLLEVKYELSDISEIISKLNNVENTSQYNLEEIMQRLEIIYKLRKKYGATIPDILKYYENAKIELYGINNSDEEIILQKKELENVKSKLEIAAQKLTKSRINAAANLEKRIINELEFLDMPKVKLKVKVTTGNKYLNNGKDFSEFLISSNAGESLKSIAKIASGGEISRIMLSLKSVLNNENDAYTLIFDEVDTGVSGKTAEKLGIKLQSLAKNKQVICITHLAQIASLSSLHYLITKQEFDGKTYTKVSLLNYMQQVNELSRIIGGINITNTIITAAKEMLKNKKEQ